MEAMKRSTTAFSPPTPAASFVRRSCSSSPEPGRPEGRRRRRLERALKSEVADVVARQVKAGIDVPNDGEFGKSTSWSLYALKRLSGFELREVKGGSPFARGADRPRFLEFYNELEGRGDGKDWSNVTRSDAVCAGPIKYNGLFELQRDIDNLKAARGGGKRGRGVPAGGRAVERDPRSARTSTTRPTRRPGRRSAEALRTEYRAIVDAGFLLQVDDARAAVTLRPDGAAGHVRGVLRVARGVHVDVLNHALRRHPGGPRALPHLLGQLAGPHTTDMPLRDDRRPDPQGQAQALLDRGRQPASRARVEGVAGREAARRQDPDPRRRQPRAPTSSSTRSWSPSGSCATRNRRPRERHRRHRLRLRAGN